MYISLTLSIVCWASYVLCFFNTLIISISIPIYNLQFTIYNLPASLNSSANGCSCLLLVRNVDRRQRTRCFRKKKFSRKIDSSSLFELIALPMYMHAYIGTCDMPATGHVQSVFSPK
jgi:hypothetical protein